MTIGNTAGVSINTIVWQEAPTYEDVFAILQVGPTGNPTATGNNDVIIVTNNAVQIMEAASTVNAYKVPFILPGETNAPMLRVVITANTETILLDRSRILRRLRAFFL